MSGGDEELTVHVVDLTKKTRKEMLRSGEHVHVWEKGTPGSVGSASSDGNASASCSDVDPVGSFLLLAAFAVSFSVDHVLVASLAGLCGWFLLYVMVRRVLEARPGCSELLDETDNLSTIGMSHVSLFHQGVVCTLLLILILAMRTIAEGDADWWAQGWGGRACMLERHVHLSIIGYELKDFTRGVPAVPWILHHVFTIAGCCLCLFTPRGMGYVTFNALNAEMGSFVYNWWALTMSRTLFPPYLVTMTASNAVGMLIGILYADLDVGLGWRVSYLLICSLLVVLRSIGCLLAIRAVCTGKDQRPADTPRADGKEAAPEKENEEAVAVTVAPVLDPVTFES